MASGVPRRGLVCSNPPPEIPKVLQNRAKLNPILKTVKKCWIYDAKPQDVRKKGSKILKLPLVHNCFTLAMTNKLVVIINSLKVPKIKKILLYEMKFLVPNYSCLQNPSLTRGLLPPDPRSLCPQLNLLNPPEQNSWLRHWFNPGLPWQKQHSARRRRIFSPANWTCIYGRKN